MSSIVSELQKECLDEDIPLKSLARKAMLVVKKLAIDETWIVSELDGYGYHGLDIPNYREVGGQVVAKVPNRGYVQVRLPQDMAIDTFPIGRSIAELEATLGFQDGYVYVLFPQEMQSAFRHLFDNHYDYYFQIPLNQIQGLLDAIRNKILEFTIRLEQKGVLGEGMAFNEKEKEKAKSMTITVNGNFQGILGDVSQSDVTQTFNNGIQGDLNALVEALKLHQVADTDITDLKTAITVDGKVVTKADDYGPEVTSWYKRMLSKAIDGSWQVGIATAGNILSTVLNGFYLAN